MARLLLRSTKSEAYPTRIDILFTGVAEMHLPTMLPGLVISLDASRPDSTGQPSGSERVRYGLATSREASRDGYFVVAVGITVDEDDKEYFEPGASYPGPAAL